MPEHAAEASMTHHPAGRGALKTRVPEGAIPKALVRALVQEALDIFGHQVAQCRSPRAINQPKHSVLTDAPTAPRGR